MNRSQLLAAVGWLGALLAVGVGIQAMRARPAAEVTVEPSLDPVLSMEGVWMAWDGPDGPGSTPDAPAEVALGSVRKWTTSVLILTLVDDGVLDLDAPVGRWLPAWKDRPEITLRRLLSHTSGLPMRPPDGTCEGAGTLEACIGRCADLPLQYEPGSRFGYGSLGFQVAARVAEAATETPFEELFAERIARPSGLERWRFEAGGDGLADMEGTLWMSPADVVRFLGAVQQGPLLSDASRMAMGAGQTGAVPKVGAIPASEWWSEGDDPHGLGMWRAHIDGPEARFWFAEGRQRVVAWVDRVQERVVVAGMLVEQPKSLAERVAPFDVIHAVCVVHEAGPDPQGSCLPFKASLAQRQVYRSCRRGKGSHRICMVGAQRTPR